MLGFTFSFNDKSLTESNFSPGLIFPDIISILILGLLIYLSANIYHIIGFTLVKLLILIKYFGLEKKNDRFKRENITNILLIILSYYFITYLLGIFIGFVQSSYLIDIVHIIKNAFPIFIFILFSELLRFEYTTKDLKIRKCAENILQL